MRRRPANCGWCGGGRVQSERLAKDNHGTWFDVFALGLHKYVGDEKQAKDVCLQAPGRVSAQVAGPLKGLGAGGLPYEDARTNTQHYHSEDAAGLLDLAGLCKGYGVDLFCEPPRPTPSNETPTFEALAIRGFARFVAVVAWELRPQRPSSQPSEIPRPEQVHNLPQLFKAPC